MNKKILSFVLAMVFSLSLGCGSLFAYYGVGSVVGSDGSVSQFGGDEGRITVSADDLDFANTENDKLSTMFGYIAGTMSFMANKTSITFADANGARAGFSISEQAGVSPAVKQYTITSLNHTGSDIAAIQKEGGLKNFLTKNGISEDALKTPKMDKEGHYLKEDGSIAKSAEEAAMVDVAWFKEAENYLSQGINTSASISFGATGGAQITVSENRLPQATLGSFGGETMVMTEYNYIPGTSCLQNVISAQVKAGVPGTDGVISYSLEYNKTVYDEFGRQDKTFLLNDKKEIVEYKLKEQTFDKDGNPTGWKDTDKTQTGPIGVYTYSANSSILAYTDNTSNQTYIYNGGQIDSVVFGFKVGVDPVQQTSLDLKTKYNYVGGVLDNVISYNNGTPTSMTVCDAYGRQLGTVSMTTNPNLTSYQARSAIEAVLKGNAKADCAVQSVTLYKDMLADNSPYKSGIIKMFGANGASKVAAMKNMNYGYSSAVGSISLTTGTKTEKEEGTYSERTNSAGYNAAKNNGAKVNTGYNYYGVSGKETKTYTVETMTYTCTVSSHGQNVQQVQNEIELSRKLTGTTRTATDVYDPAVVGTVDRIVKIDGKEYAVLKNAQVDMVDGKGFQATEDGEELYVCIDGLDEKPEVGQTFAAAGYIDTSLNDAKDENGNKIYAINGVYESKVGKDGESVDNMVQSFSATLAGNADYQANLASNMVTFAKAAEDGKTYKDWKSGWELLLQYGGGAPAQF